MRLLSRRAPALLGSAAVAASVLLAPSAASANPPGPHDPLGKVSSVTAQSNGTVLAKGWAFDPDAKATNIVVGAVLDGRTTVAKAPTSVANAKVAQKYGTGATPSFALTVPVPSGNHTLCFVALGAPGMPGLSTVLRCVALPLGRAVYSSEKSTHSPVGAIASASAGTSSYRITGWASDPDFVARRSVAVLYIDNVSVATVTTRTNRTPAANAGRRSAFDITVPVSSGTHVGCLWVVNVGWGENTFLGCRTVDTRGPAGTGTVVQPDLNKKVVAEAKRHIGQPYVWGATGPKSFDCSGLVLYTYKKYGFATPRISEDQRTAARLIPASRAVPGDLVFYHDSTGDVYHVGIYLSPGKTVAAIDTNSGVNYQMIWDPSSTTYGSFTHT